MNVTKLIITTKTDQNREQLVQFADGSTDAKAGSYCTLTYEEAGSLLAALNKGQPVMQMLSFLNGRHCILRGSLATQAAAYLTELFAPASPSE